jgi:hypothetical protein
MSGLTEAIACRQCYNVSDIEVPITGSISETSHCLNLKLMLQRPAHSYRQGHKQGIGEMHDTRPLLKYRHRRTETLLHCTIFCANIRLI